MGVTRPGGAILAVTVLLGAAVGIGAAMLGGGSGEGGPPVETTVESAATTTTLPRSGFWTAVIASVQADRPDAQAQADSILVEAGDKGQEAFVLEGSAYEGLNDAYLAVCVGRFADQSEAVSQVEALRGLGYDPYPRNVGDLTGDGGNPDDGGEDGDGEDA